MSGRSPGAAVSAAAAGLFARAVAHHRQGALEQARILYEKVLFRAPDLAEAHANLGAVLHRMGRSEDAIARLAHAILLKPAFVDAHVNLGNALRQLGRLDDALAAYDRAAEIRPALAQAHGNRAAVLVDLGRFEEAVTAGARAIDLDPRQAQAHSNLGLALKAMGRVEEAVRVLERAVALAPGVALAHSNLGNALKEAGRFDEALACHERAVALGPESAEAHANLGIVLQELGRLDDALRAYERAVQLKPDYPEAHGNMGHVLLLQGRFAEGWREMEWRWRAKGFAPARRTFPAPRWDGGGLAGKTILLHDEQGFGDALQCIRYAPLVQERGARVIVECQAPLAALFRANLDLAGIFPQGAALPPFDVECPFLTLPGLFGTDATTIPAGDGYLGRVAEVAFERGERPTVGIVWRGNPVHRNDRNRSLDLALLRDLASDARFDFVSLQVGFGEDDPARHEWAGRLRSVRPLLVDFAATAGVIARLDLVIAVDTAVAHLAGAMGRPVWVLLPAVPDWRWRAAGETTPWYRSMRLFRQRRRGDWEPVVEDARRALVERFSAGAP